MRLTLSFAPGKFGKRVFDVHQESTFQELHEAICKSFNRGLGYHLYQFSYPIQSYAAKTTGMKKADVLEWCLAFGVPTEGLKVPEMKARLSQIAKRLHADERDRQRAYERYLFRGDDDDDDAAREPRGDATPRDGPDPTSALPWSSKEGVKENAERTESPVVSIAISDSEDGEEDAGDATRKRRRGDEDDDDDVAASRRAPKDSGSPSPSRPPTRAPSFARASSAQLERELAKHGMKPGPREYMTRELARAWAAGAALPPDFFEPDAEASRRRAEAEAPSPRPSDTRGHAGGGDRSDSAGGALEDALGRFIKSNVALYERVLLMETVDVDEVLATVRRAPAPLAPGVAVAKVPRAKLLAYLEREGVAVTHTSGRRARATRTRF